MSQQKHAVTRTRSLTKGTEESIYNLGNNTSGTGPKVITYNIGPTSPTGPSLPPVPKTKMHANSSQISSIINPVKGVRDAQARAGIAPVNHAKNNAKAIKEQSQLNALRKLSIADDDAPKRPPSALARSTSAPTRRMIRSDSDNGRDYVEENKISAAAPIRSQKIQPPKDDGTKYLAKKDYGKVPVYLLERKAEMIADYEAKQRAKEAAMIPPGMRMMPEDERLQTLAILQQNKVEVEKAMQMLPLRIETPGQIRRRDELERRLREIEDAFKIFSKPKVLVHI